MKKILLILLCGTSIVGLALADNQTPTGCKCNEGYAVSCNEDDKTCTCKPSINLLQIGWVDNK